MQKIIILFFIIFNADCSEYKKTMYINLEDKTDYNGRYIARHLSITYNFHLHTITPEQFGAILYKSIAYKGNYELQLPDRKTTIFIEARE